MLLIAAVALLFLTSWSVIPAPIMLLFPLSLAGPELSPWLMAAAILIALVSRRKWVVLVCGLSFLCSAAPLVSYVSSRATRTAAFHDLSGLTTVLPAPRIRPIQVRPDVRYPVRSGMLHMVVYGPVEAGAYPAIVMVYGGAWQRGAPEDNAEFARHMAQRGYTVCAIDYRHAPEFQFPVPLEDIQQGVEFIRNHAAELQVDAGRIALLGRSSGGHLALLAAYQPSLKPVRAVVTYYAPTDLTEGYEDVPVPDPIHVRSVLETFMGGPPAKLSERYIQASPVTYATSVQPPTLLIQGGRDHIVKPRFAQELQSKLHASGTPVVRLEFPWAEHGFDAIFQGLSNREALDYTERFLAWATK